MQVTRIRREKAETRMGFGPVNVGLWRMASALDGIPVHLVAARATTTTHRCSNPPWPGSPDMIGPLPDQPCLHLDRGYDSTKTRDLLEILGYHADIAVKGTPAPIQAGKRWPVERTHS